MAEARTAELALMSLLAKRETAHSGVATCVLKTAFVAGIDAARGMFPGTLWENLLYGEAMIKRRQALDEEAAPAEEQVWEICNRAGMSHALIGAEFAPGWAQQTPQWLYVDMSE